MNVSYRLKNLDDVGGEIQRIVIEQIDRAVGEIDTLDVASAVHQARKRCKKIRAVLRLARGVLDKDGTYQTENARYRDIARDLSVMRDADVMIETHDAVTADIHNPDVRIECDAIRGRLTVRRRRIAGENVNPQAQLRAARAGLAAGREHVPEWAGRLRRFRDLKPGLEKTYRRGRRAMKAAYDSSADETFHELRKRAKYHWYACRLLRDIWAGEMDARRDELRRLSRLLGDEHDFSVYRAALRSNPDWFGHASRRDDILAVVDRRRDALRREARQPALRIYAEKSGQLAKRFRRYWRSASAKRVSG